MNTTLRTLINKALSDADSLIKEGSARPPEVKRTEPTEEISKLASALEYISVNLGSLERSPAEKLAEYEVFLSKIGALEGFDGGIPGGFAPTGLSPGAPDTVIPNDLSKVDPTMGATQVYPVAASNQPVPPSGEMPVRPGDPATANLADDAARLAFGETSKTAAPWVPSKAQKAMMGVGGLGFLAGAPAMIGAGRSRADSLGKEVGLDEKHLSRAKNVNTFGPNIRGGAASVAGMAGGAALGGAIALRGRPVGKLIGRAFKQSDRTGKLTHTGQKLIQAAGPAASAGAGLGALGGAVLGSRSEAKKDVGTQLVNQTLERNRAEKTAELMALYEMGMISEDDVVKIAGLPPVGMGTKALMVGGLAAGTAAPIATLVAGRKRAGQLADEVGLDEQHKSRAKNVNTFLPSIRGSAGMAAGALAGAALGGGAAYGNLARKSKNIGKLMARANKGGMAEEVVRRAILPGAVAGTGVGALGGGVLGHRSEAKKDVRNQLYKQTLERDRAAKVAELLEKSALYGTGMISGAIGGAQTISNRTDLSDEQKAVARRNMGAGGAGRGALWSIPGALAGATIGSLGGHTGALIGGLAGDVAGGYYGGMRSGNHHADGVLLASKTHGKSQESAEKTSGYDRLYNMLKMASDLDNPADFAPQTEDPPMVSPDPIGAPVGGPAMVPIAQSAEAMIGTSPRAVADANKAEMLQYISEDGQDGTLDMLEAAKVAHNKARVLSFLDKEAGVGQRLYNGVQNTADFLVGAEEQFKNGPIRNALRSHSSYAGGKAETAGRIAAALTPAAIVGGGAYALGKHKGKKEQAKAASMQTPDPMDKIKESLASIVAGMED